MDWDFSCPDWRDRLRDRRSLVPTLPLWSAEADRAASIFNKLRLYDVIGTPTMAEAGGEWFLDMVRAVHGSLDPTTGRRKVPGVFMMVPKKNNKTTGSGLFMLTSLIMNRRPSAAFALFAPTQDTADKAFEAAGGAIELDPTLKALFRVVEHQKLIEHRRTGAGLKIQSFDPKIATGGKFAGWLLDELHVLGASSYGTKVLTQMRGARAAIWESFGVIITTQSDSAPAGVFKQELDYARRVRDGAIKNGEILPILYEFPAEVQSDPARPWSDPALWPLVLPNLGRSVDLETLLRLYAEAREKGPAAEREWASQHLNIEIGLALHADRWEGADFWERAALKEGLTLDDLIRRSEVAIVGVDGGGLDDLFGLAVIGRERGTGRWLIWGHAWCDHDVKNLRKEIAARLDDFASDGDLTFVTIGSDQPDDSGEAVNGDIAAIADVVERLWNAGLLPEKYAIGLDPVGVAQLTAEIERRGLPNESMAAIGQGYRLNGAIKGLARKLKDGSARHGGRPLMAWCVGNAKTEIRGSATVITKAAAGKAKIDPLMALFNAAELMARNPEAAGKSFWEAA